LGNILGNIFSRTSRQVSVNQEDTSKELRTLDPQVTRVLLNWGARLNQRPLIFSKAVHEASSACAGHAHEAAETRWSLCLRDA
jgi:hypothetical protein